MTFPSTAGAVSAWCRCALVLWPLLLVFPAVGADSGSSARGENNTPFRYEAEVLIPMRDGIRLAANIFKPQDDARHPVVLMRTPYGKPDRNFGEARRYTAAGYVVVAQDCRGRGKSAGAWEPFRYDADDGFDTQEWVGRQPWCNGELGTFGGSYVGWTQWASAPGASAHLKCMVPMVPFADIFEELAYPGGAFQLALLMGWGTGVGGVTLSPEKLQTAFRHLPLRTFGDQFEKKVPYLNDWVQHSTYDDYWKHRGIDHRARDVTVPVLNIGGWYDIFSRTTIDLINQVRATSRDRLARRNQFVIMGPWAHGVGTRKVGQLDFGKDASMNLGDLQFQWFEYWLQGRTAGADAVEQWPEVRLFVMGENRWRDEHEWPLKRTRFTSYYVHSGGRANTRAGDGTLNTTEPGDENPDRFLYDPNDPVPSTGGNNLVGAPAGPHDQTEVEDRRDVLVYTTSPLTEAVEVTGPVKMILWAATAAADTDFTAKLVDVHPDGKAYNLCDGIRRARFREGGVEPRAVTPGEATRYEIDLWVTSNLFQREHRIRVEVSSSNFPRFDRNPNSGKPFGTDTELLQANQTVYHDRPRASHLVLPVIPQ